MSSVPSTKVAVLVVDDEPSLADALADVLEHEGFRASVALDGRQGLAALEALVPDLVIADRVMPVLDGPGMVKAMRAEPAWSSIPVILISGHGHAHADSGDGRLWQASLMKPFTAEDLLGAISLLLPATRAALSRRLALPR